MQSQNPDDIFSSVLSAPSVMARSALLLLLGALFFTACSAQTGYRVDAQQRIDGLPLEQFSRSVFLSSICNYFSLDVDLVRASPSPLAHSSRYGGGGSTPPSRRRPRSIARRRHTSHSLTQCYITNLYYADSGTVVLYTCYLVRWRG
jgi:hypothetical protein